MGLPIDKLLANNLDRIFKERGITNAVIAEEKLRVPKSTVDRAWRCRSMTKINTLQELAGGLKIQAWQLLVPDFDPKNLPILESAPPSAAEVDKEHLKIIPASSPQNSLNSEQLLILINAFSQSTVEGRAQILRMAKTTAKIFSSGGGSSTEGKL